MIMAEQILKGSEPAKSFKVTTVSRQGKCNTNKNSNKQNLING